MSIVKTPSKLSLAKRPFPARYHLKNWLTALLLVVITQATFAEDQTWKINLKNADIREFITQISTITGKSFIVDQRVKGKVTVISNTSLDADATYELFLSVLRVHGYAAVPTQSAVKIVQQVLAKQSGSDMDFVETADGEQLITRVISVTNTTAIELVKILRPMIPQYGHIAGLNTPNALIISDHAENIKRLVKIVESIDVADNTVLMILQLKDAWVEDIVALLEKLAPEEIGKAAKGPNSIRLVANARNNSLVLKGEARTLAKMKDLVEKLDTPADDSSSIQVIRLANADAADMAEILKNLISDQDSKSNKSDQKISASVQADESLNALIIRADPAQMFQLKSVIELLDTRRVQVLIEAAIIEVTTDFAKDLGSELIIGDPSGEISPLGITAPSGILARILLAQAGVPSDTIPAIPPDSDLGTSPLLAAGKVKSDGVSFAFILRALIQNSDVDLLSTPSITTLDNQEAKIVVGQSVPFRTGSTTTGSGGTVNPFTTIERSDVGLTLQVTPHIHDANLVRLEIHQEVSEVDQLSFGNVGTDSSSDLITNKRTIDTTILVDDGEIIILGGLIRDKITYSESKVPILGSIPLLGRLFKSNSNKHEKQNLLVFLRPTILTTKENIAEVSRRKYNAVWESEIKGIDPVQLMSESLDGRTR
jgi:general secretion pathway protein D